MAILSPRPADGPRAALRLQPGDPAFQSLAPEFGDLRTADLFRG